MDESALRIALTACETAWSGLEKWFWICALAVLVGVLFEVIPIVWDHLAEEEDFKRGIIHSPDKPLKLRFFLELFGSFLVAVGVFGELYVGIRMAKVETCMRDDTAQLVSIVDKKAEDADVLAATLEKSNVEERKKVVALEEELAWRELSPSQSVAIQEALEPFSGTKFLIEFPENDGEAELYAQDFERVLKNSGWISGQGPVAVVTSPTAIGLWLVSNSRANPPAAALQRALDKLMIPSYAELDPGMTPGTVEIRVGVKARPQDQSDRSSK